MLSFEGGGDSECVTKSKIWYSLLFSLFYDSYTCAHRYSRLRYLFIYLIPATKQGCHPEGICGKATLTKEIGQLPALGRSATTKGIRRPPKGWGRLSDKVQYIKKNLTYLFISFTFLLRSCIPKGYVDHTHQGKNPRIICGKRNPSPPASRCAHVPEHGSSLTKEIKKGKEKGL